jgi:hypothetical protein
VAPLATTKRRSKKHPPPPSRRPTSLIKPGKYTTLPAPVPDEHPPNLPHQHKFKQVLIDIALDFNKDCLMQFEGDNGKKVVYAIQQLILNLKIADKTAILNPTEDNPDAPPIGGNTTHKVPQNMTA